MNESYAPFINFVKSINFDYNLFAFILKNKQFHILISYFSFHLFNIICIFEYIIIFNSKVGAGSTVVSNGTVISYKIKKYKLRA